jgi:hypothetical protein
VGGVAGTSPTVGGLAGTTPITVRGLAGTANTFHCGVPVPYNEGDSCIPALIHQNTSPHKKRGTTGWRGWPTRGLVSRDLQTADQSEGLFSS